MHNPTLLVALNELTTEQAKPCESIIPKIKMLLDCAETYPNATIRYIASDMVLHIDSDAGYLVTKNAKSRVAGHYYVSSRNLVPLPLPNGLILTECKSLHHVVGSATEAETGGLYHNGQTAIPIRFALMELGHPQPLTPFKTDNSMANVFVNTTLCQKHSKSWDMCYHWLRDRIAQKHLHVFWDKGRNNLANYFNKHHPPHHHRIMRPKYIHFSNIIFQAISNSFNSDHV
jgi:hypothetical protein